VLLRELVTLFSTYVLLYPCAVVVSAHYVMQSRDEIHAFGEEVTRDEKL